MPRPDDGSDMFQTVYLRVLDTLIEALGLDPDDDDACADGCEDGPAGLEHYLWHLIDQRDAARAELAQRGEVVGLVYGQRPRAGQPFLTSWRLSPPSLRAELVAVCTRMNEADPGRHFVAEVRALAGEGDRG